MTAPIDRPVATTSYGPVRGIDDGVVKVWKGVRYAAAPVGELRWRAPQPPPTWHDAADASKVGPACPQPTDPRIPLQLGAAPGEDSLVLNVWASSDTSDGARKPVMVWVHGGAYLIGASSQPLYHAAALAASGEVIVVTFNYRLGPFGFLDLSSFGADRFATNPGLRDVLFALEWVRDNIAAFGGDPDRVTLFGESAGAGIVTTLLTSPAAEGLFSAAIAQSSPTTAVYDANRGRRFAEAYLGELGLAADEADRLLHTPVEDLVTAARRLFEAVPAQRPGTLAFVPIVDGDIVPDYPVERARQGRSLPVPLIIGTNEHEATLFRFVKSPIIPIKPKAIELMFDHIAAEQPGLQMPSEADIISAYPGLRRKARGLGVGRDLGFRMPSVWFAEGHATVAPVYMYRFDWATPVLKLLRLGAAHATELPYTWGNLAGGPKDPTFKLGGLRSGREVSQRMRRRWINFATSADPTAGPDQPLWRPYHSDDRATLVIDRHDTVVADLDHDLRVAWGSEVLTFR